MNLDQRLRRLEDALLVEPMVLFFPGGATRELPGSGEKLLHLYYGILEGHERNPHLRTEAEWIRTAIDGAQPGGGHMFDLLRLAVSSQQGEELWPTEQDASQTGAKVTSSGRK
jgi:hypothetical protein